MELPASIESVLIAKNTVVVTLTIPALFKNKELVPMALESVPVDSIIPVAKFVIFAASAITPRPLPAEMVPPFMTVAVPLDSTAALLLVIDPPKLFVRLRLSGVFA